MMPDSLAGKRIVITRPPHKADAFAARLRDLGAEPVLVPVIDIQPPSDPTPLDQALARLDQFDWLIITSANTVAHIWQRLALLDLDAAQMDWPAVAVIGPATGKALAQKGVHAALMPDAHVAEALFAALAKRTDLKGARVLLAQGNLARPVLGDRLREAGAKLEVVIAYENVPSKIDAALLETTFDAVTFTSSSTVENFVAMFDDPLRVIGRALVVCIGPVTAHTAHELGLPVHMIAEPHTVDGLISALSKAFERNPEK